MVPLGLSSSLRGPDLVLCDIKMEGMDGIEVLTNLKATGSDTPVIMISGHGDIDTAVETIKKGAYDFIQKPSRLKPAFITVEKCS